MKARLTLPQQYPCWCHSKNLIRILFTLGTPAEPNLLSGIGEEASCTLVPEDHS